MTEAIDLDRLARRYLDLWEEQAIAWAGDATVADSIRLWLGGIGAGGPSAAKADARDAAEGTSGDERRLAVSLGNRIQPAFRSGGSSAFPVGGLAGFSRSTSCSMVSTVSAV